MSTEKKQDSSAKLVLVLFAISVVTALLLGLVNMVTAPVIAANNQRVADEAKAEVLPTSGEYVEVTDQYTGGDPNVLGVYQAGEDGYVVEIQSSGFGGMISFELDSEETAHKLLSDVKMILFAESLGGTETLVTYPLTQTHESTPPDVREKLGINERFIRISIGIEDPRDIIADLEQALG